MLLFCQLVLASQQVPQRDTRRKRETVACLQAVTGGFIAENLWRSLIGCHLGFLRRALPGTSGRAQKQREAKMAATKSERVFSPKKNSNAYR